MPQLTEFTAGSGTRSLAYLFDIGATSIAYLVFYAWLEAMDFGALSSLWYSVAVFVYQAYFLSRNCGMTPGKYVRNICVLSSTGQPLSLPQAYLRAFLTALPYACFFSGPLQLNVIAHGLVSAVPTVGVALLFADLLMLEYARDRRTLTDRIAGTVVAMLPPVQPHRAPAAPMYSATDTEFGNAPRHQPSAQE